MEKKKIVFLYTELASYFLACVKELLMQTDVEVHIVRWSLNKEAPFDFKFTEDFKIYDRKKYSTDDLQKLVSEINPDMIFSSGWIDKGYLAVCKKYKSRIPVIVGFDNQWKGTLKQHFATLISPFKILNHFSHCWVPGLLQKQFALKLGFKEKNILTGFYCCDFDLFYNQYLENKTQKQNNFPKRLLYVGRYVEHKGILDLWKAFIELQDESPNDWELWCIGTGELKPVIHPKIKHFGFVQPKDLSKFIKTSGVFILPSHFEPWGVVIHEFAAAGFPIICSDEVGARTTFVEENYNGYIYKSGNTQQLKNILKKTMSLSNEQLFEMGEHSVEKGKLITPEIWSKTLISLL